MLLRSRLLNIPSRGLWSTERSKSLQPSVNILLCCKLHEAASASPLVGEYRLSAGWVKREPAYINFQPLAQQTTLLAF